MLSLTVVAILVALVFELINGFHDCANAIATTVSTRILSLKQAILLAATLNFVGAMFIGGVAKVISSGLITELLSTQMIICALGSAIIWNMLTWYWGLPSSSSHALIGGIIGVAVERFGPDVVQYKNIALKVLLPIIISPVMGAIVGLLIAHFAHRYLAHKRWVGRLQLLSASFMAFSHGTNDAQKTVGIITMLLLSNQIISDNNPPLWVVLLCATTMAIGTLFGGKRIIETMGNKITDLRPVDGFAAETGAALVIESATMLGAPISTTHVIASSIIGVGYNNHLMNNEVIVSMCKAWVFTLPICITLGYLLSALTHVFPT